MQIPAILETQHTLGATAPPSNFKRPNICTSWGAMPTNSFTSWCAWHAAWALAPSSLVSHCSRSWLAPCFLGSWSCLCFFFARPAGPGLPPWSPLAGKTQTWMSAAHHRDIQETQTVWANTSLSWASFSLSLDALFPPPRAFHYF